MRADTLKIIAHVYLVGGVVLHSVNGTPWLLWIGAALVIAENWVDPFVDWIVKRRLP